jgi:hypothetical protein
VSKILISSLLVLVTLSGVAGAGSGTSEGELSMDLADLASDNELLRLELELASGKDFYLLLDCEHLRLFVMLSGVVLHEYEVSGLEVGAPRILFFTRRAPAGWLDGIWTRGALDPARERDRLEIVVNPDGSEKSPAEPPVPPAEEQERPVPAPYWIRFEEGYAVEVRAQTPEGEECHNWHLAWRLGMLAKELAGALGVGGRDKERLVISMTEDDAAALYRSLPPGVRFLAVVPSTPGFGAWR